VSFSALWGVFYHSSDALFTAKKQCFWLPELANESTVCKERDLVCLHKITSGLVGCKKETVVRRVLSKQVENMAVRF